MDKDYAEKQIRTVYKETEYFDIGENVYTFFTQSSLTENLHSHEFWELSYVYGNEAVNIMPQGSEKVGPGEFVIISPGARHAIRSLQAEQEKRARVCNLLIRDKYMKLLLKKYADFCDLAQADFYKMITGGHAFCLHLKDDDSLAVKQCLWQIKAEFEQRRMGCNDIISNEILSLLILMTRLATPDCGEGTAKNNFERLKKYININYAMPLGLELLASEMGFSREHLSRCFKKQCGINVSEYITGVRVEKAKEFLKLSEDSIEAIAEEAGFNTISAFQKAFKKETGMSPREYRREYRS